MELSILLWIQEHLRVGWLNPIMVCLSLFGNAGWGWIVVSAALLVSKRTRRLGGMMLLAMAGCALLNNVVLKQLIARPRPFSVCPELVTLVAHPTDWSFPSGHTCASFAAACTVWRLEGRKWGVPAVVLAALIGFSRMYVGVHYPTDVLAGMLVGIFGSWAVLIGFQKWEASRRRKKEQK